MRRSLSSALVAALAAVVLAGAAVPAEAAGSRHTFASPSPSYKRTDSNGTFTAQVSARWTATNAVTMPWAFTVAPKIRAIAAGRMTCKAGHMQLPYYSDHHANIAVTYTWHSSVPRNARNKNYDMWGHCAVPVKVGGKTGTANPRFSFAYRVSGPAQRSAMAPQAEEGTTEYSSELTIF